MKVPSRQQDQRRECRKGPDGLPVGNLDGLGSELDGRGDLDQRGDRHADGRAPDQAENRAR